MYQIINHETGVLITETIQVTFVKQQKRVDRPILANNLAEADGVIFYVGGEEYQLGIAKDYAKGEPNMLNYTPLVDVVEVPDGPYVSGQIRTVQHQNENTDSKLDAQQALTLTSLQGQADQYTTALNMQAQIDAQQQLNLTALQGIADLYAALLTLQTPTTTPETEE